MYDDILFPYDGSDGASDALDHVAAIASWCDATVHVLYVADTNRDSVTVVGGEAVDSLVTRGEETVDEARAALTARGVDHEAEVAQGGPARTIVDYAERYGLDLIAMPTNGRKGLSRRILGSVTEKVVRLSPVPVLAVRMADDERLSFPYEDVLVPTDGSRRASAAVDHGIALAGALDARVHALSVVDDSLLGGLGLENDPDADGADDAEAAATDVVDAVAADAEAAGVREATASVVRGDLAEEIRAYVEANGVDAVVMGTTGRRGTERILLGSVAEKTVRTAPVPVLTVGAGTDEE
ncbi:universal stress protein [Halobaculum gomorrense]|uniref:Nucleotide-binding universal stress protein, UspA family n=1 Tax=Halobaculum gomorrense TaxID=43928 RepID=A0A1M5SIT7_9EURY|nr:universal stress protein [Halobaculum gomorrense]SHH38320.1 Nucleotide-binding universal stress protein, UspA family [Halobaculum gomorrense]